MAEQKNKIGPIWVIAEQIDCRLLTVSTQLIGQARRLADELHTSVEAILLGDDIERRAQELIAAGADRIYLGNECCERSLPQTPNDCGGLSKKPVLHPHSTIPTSLPSTTLGSMTKRPT